MSMDKMINKDEIKKIFNSYALKHGYSEPPPTIIEFICDDYYLGKTFNNGKSIYKYWLETLVKMFPTPFPELNKIRNNAYTDNYIILNTSAISTGKTTVSNIIFLYDLAHVLCLENPQAFYKLSHNTKIDFIVSNSTKENSETINFALILGMIRNSPFFLSKLNNKTKTSMFEKNIDLLPISPYRRQLTGRAVFSILMDELNRHPQPKQALAYVTEAINRLPSRFLSENKGKKYVPGHILIISSADTDTSLIEQIKFSLTSEENESTIKNPLLLINAKQFEVLKEKINFSDKYFYVFTGTYNLEPKILEGDELEYYKNKYPDKIEKVPYDYYLSFKQNLRQAIGDILGIPVISSSSFISDKSVITQAFKHKNPTTSIIEYDNNVPLINYFNIEILKELLNNYKGKQFVLGLDLAYSNDKLGIALGCIKKIENNQKYVDVIFATALTPASGQKIKFSRIRKFILDLREKFGIHIAKIYADTFQSYDFITIMQDLGFDAKQHSVDRKKDSYYALKNALYENLIDLPENSLLEKELIFLKENEKKIDHPDTFPDGTPGSKDIADAVCQVYSAILDLEYKEFYEKNYLKELEKQLDIEIVKTEMKVEENDFYNNLLKGKIENIYDYI